MSFPYQSQNMSNSSNSCRKTGTIYSKPKFDKMHCSCSKHTVRVSINHTPAQTEYTLWTAALFSSRTYICRVCHQCDIKTLRSCLRSVQVQPQLNAKQQPVSCLATSRQKARRKPWCFWETQTPEQTVKRGLCWIPRLPNVGVWINGCGQACGWLH